MRAGWVTEGVSAFDELSGSPPVSIRQQALRGLAKIALERSDRVAAKVGPHAQLHISAPMLAAIAWLRLALADQGDAAFPKYSPESLGAALGRSTCCLATKMALHVQV